MYKIDYEDPEIELLRERLSMVSGKCRAFIKGASEAFLYVQENQSNIPDHYDPPLTILKHFISMLEVEKDDS